MGQVFKPLFDCQAIFLSPHADIDCLFAPNCERCSGDFVMRPQPPPRIGRRNHNRVPKTAHAIRASFGASATTTTFLCARLCNPRAQRPNGVSRSTK